MWTDDGRESSLEAYFNNWVGVDKENKVGLDPEQALQRAFKVREGGGGVEFIKCG